eukprot:gene13831-16589_t
MEETDSERVRAEAVVNGLRSRLKPDHREAVVAAGVQGTARQQLRQAIASCTPADAAPVLKQYSSVLANNDIEEGGVRPLHAAAANGCSEIVTLLLEHGADPDQMTTEKWTALHNASSAGHHVVVHILIQANADLNVPTVTGASPLHIAAEAGHARVVECLLAND